tara:strand:+ start:3227 stop:3592 length:366 start_codon:yes stop_codon:yes gene_type:complete
MSSKLKPKLNPGKYVFCKTKNLNKLEESNIISIFKEGKNITVITKKEYAELANLEFYFVCAWITLKIKSTLDSHGLTYIFSKALYNKEISCNVIAGYEHDHIFVPYEKKDEALGILSGIKI